jgi:hypothetical protein
MSYLISGQLPLQVRALIIFTSLDRGLQSMGHYQSCRDSSPFWVSLALVNEIAPRHWTMEDIRVPFDRQFGEILASHRLFLRVADEAFTNAVEEARATLNPEGNDEGDVYAAAQESIGVSPYDVSQHLGLMALTRAVSLAEVTIARAAASFFTDAEGLVFTDGKAWTRQQAISFFKTVLIRPVHIDEAGMDAVTDLRNAYSHGYGDLKNANKAEQLEKRLLELAAGPPATAEEIDAGYGERLTITRVAPSGYFEDHWQLPVAHLSPLAALRLIRVTERTVHGVLDAAAWGPKQGEELNTSRFVKDWAKSAGQVNVGATVLDYEGRVRLQVLGKHVELLDLPGGQEGLLQHMQDGEYDSRIEFRKRNRGS